MTHVSGHTAYTKQVRTPYVPGTQGVKQRLNQERPVAGLHTQKSLKELAHDATVLPVVECTGQTTIGTL